MSIVLYHHPFSRAANTVWMLEEVGANYEIKLLKWETGEHKSPEYLKINSMGKIPAIVHRGVTVTENAAICTYLADAFPHANLAPSITDAQRGSYYRWLFFAASCLEPAMLDKSNPRQDSPAASHLGHGSYQDVVKTLEVALGSGDYLCADKFTTADLYMASNLEWYIFTKALDPKPVFQRYIQRCKDRPAYRRFEEQAGKFG